MRYGLWAALILALGVPLAARSDMPDGARQQLQFGVEMAQRSLWSEALFRFRQAEKQAPEDASVQNNLAVAHEALGLFDEALQHYRRAIRLDPQNRALKANYARFVEFYERFRPEEEGEEVVPDAEVEATDQEPPAAETAARGPVRDSRP